MKKIITIFLSHFFVSILMCQQLVTITTKKEYKNLIAANAENKLVNIKTICPAIQLDLKYNTAQNFTKAKLYTNANTTYLRNSAANALVNVQQQLQKLGYSLKIYDAYRPYAATVLMWDLIKDERYVANPKSGSNHNRGLAIDLTIVDKKGIELNMGTGFDNFTDTAHHSFIKLPATILQNRKLLKSTMEEYGFKALETEWWHFSFVNTGSTAVFDLSFKVLQKLIK